MKNIYNKITKLAEKLVSTGQEIEQEYGIPIVNKRISVTTNCTSWRRML